VTLTDANKAHIDSLPYNSLLSHWRFASAGDPWFEGETGKYWAERMRTLREQTGGNDEHVRASKALGWNT